MKVYTGSRAGGVPEVLVMDDAGTRPLNPGVTLTLRNHSPDGFNWGYGGSGPSQLALGILYDATGDADTALEYYQRFKWAFVGGWPDSWTLADHEIAEWLGRERAKDAAAGPVFPRGRWS